MFQTFAKKALTLDYLRSHNHLKLFSQDVTTTGAKRFVVTSYEHVHKGITTSNLDHMYENVEGNQPVKLHLDIDQRLDKELAIHEWKCMLLDYVRPICDHINTVLCDKYGIEDSPYMVMMAYNPVKLSCHIVYPRIVFANIDHHRFFMHSIQLQHECVDMSIYRVGCFRCLGCAKLGKNNRLRLFKVYNMEDDKADHDYFMDSLVTNVPQDVEPIRFTKEQVIKHCSTIKRATTETWVRYVPIELSRVKAALDLLDAFYVNDFMGWVVITYALKDLYIHTGDDKVVDLWEEWCKQSKSYDKDHNKSLWDAIRLDYVTINTLFNKAHMECRVRNYIDIQKATFTPHKWLAQNCIYSEEARYIHPDIHQAIVQYKTSFIKSPTGTGKTTVLSKLLDNHKRRVLAITSRVCLAEEISKRLDLEFYQDIHGIIDAKRVVVQLESLVRLDITEYEGALIILDEVNSILGHFSSSTMNNHRRLIYDKLVWLLRSCKHVVCLDADLCDWNVEFVTQVVQPKDKPLIYWNKFKNRSGVKATITNSYEEVLADMTASKHFVSCFSSKSTLLRVMAELKLPEEECLVYHADSETKIDTSQWTNKYVFFSPKILYGLDYSHDVPKKVYAFVDSRTLNAFQVYQQVSRVRNQDAVMVYCNLNPLPLKYMSVEEAQADLEEDIQSMKQYNKLEDVAASENYKFLKVNSMFFDENMKTNMVEYLKQLFVNNGYEVQVAVADQIASTKLTAVAKNVSQDKLLRRLQFLRVDWELDENQPFDKFIQELVADDKKMEKHIHFTYLVRSDEHYEKTMQTRHELCDTEEELCRSSIVKIGYLRRLGKILGLSHNYHFDYDQDKAHFGTIIDETYLRPHGMAYEEFTKFMVAVIKAFRYRAAKVEYDTYGHVWHMFVSFFRSTCGGKFVNDNPIMVRTGCTRSWKHKYCINDDILKLHKQLSELRYNSN
jgi:hypothetical protein